MKLEELTPPRPNTLEDTGLDFSFLADLTLKTVYSDTNCTTERIAQKLRVPMTIAEPLLKHLCHEKFLHVRGESGLQNYKYLMLDHGWERAHRILEINGYIGPAPVTLQDYTARTRMQEQAREAADPQLFQKAFADLVLPERTLQTLNLVARSRRTLFMTGPPGNGKTSIARALHAALGGEVWIPFAIEVDGQIIKVFDIHNHEPVANGVTGRFDERWIKIKRPRVMVGGELTIEEMDLIYSPTARFYEAPFQVKSNGGTLVIDDFGRQRVNPRDLLNRWIIPLENRIDYLTMHTGKKIEVPFEQLLIFASNLDPKNLVDAAFLRRIGYRLQVDTPTLEAYETIFRRAAESRGLTMEPGLIEMLMGTYRREGRELRCCEPNDLMERCLDIMGYENLSPVLDKELLYLSWVNYFGAAPE